MLGVLFVLSAIGERSSDSGPLKLSFTVASWLIWTAFVVEFVVRLIIAPSAATFLKKNWWQLVFLVVPVLRVLRVFQSLRVLRATRVISGSLRSARSAGAAIRDRLIWLSTTSAIVILACAEILYEFGDFARFSDALRAAAIAAVAGESMNQKGYVARGIEILLLVYSVVIVAALAGSIGAFFVQSEQRKG